MTGFRRITMFFVALAALVVLAMSDPAQAQWPTTSWTVLDDRASGGLPPTGGREQYATKHKEILEHASVWFQALGFKAPYQVNESGSFRFRGNEKYLAFLDPDTSNFGSSHTSWGHMILSTHLGFLKPLTANDRLFQAAAVHELFHGVQLAYPAYRAYSSRPNLPKLPDCDAGERADSWLTEGTASAVQVQYLERQQGRTFRHAFHGSRDVRWVRAFDQSLDLGRLTPAQHAGEDVRHYSWQCSYGTWYFWYALGNMLGSNDPRDSRRTAYLRYIFEQEGEWSGTALARVDAGLKQAAYEMKAVPSYRGGLFSLYPQFVAQYLDVDQFFNDVEYVTLTPPSVFEASSQGLKDPIEPLATRAWRVRVQLPEGFDPAPYTVRFVLESSDSSALDSLHLIVDDRVIARPESSSIPYSHTRRVELGGADDGGGIDFFVRVANVARDAANTPSAVFTLRVEVEGFYGELPSQGSVLGAIPPGFVISGPSSNWTCSGGDDARATFAYMTPEGLADQLERMLPQGLKNIESDLDRAELQAQKKGDAELQRTQRERQRFESEFQPMMETSGAQANVARAVAEIRRMGESYILIKLDGTNASGACNVLITLTVPGAPVAQRVPPDNFSIAITTEAFSNAVQAASELALTMDFSQILSSMDLEQAQKMGEQLQQAMQAADTPESDWTRCSSVQRDCSDGDFALGEASQERLFGSFEFQVYRGELVLVRGSTIEDPREYADVKGFINITSTKDENDNNLLDFLSRGRAGDLLRIPGLEGFFQGGSMFGQ